MKLTEPTYTTLQRRKRLAMAALVFLTRDILCRVQLKQTLLNNINNLLQVLLIDDEWWS